MDGTRMDSMQWTQKGSMGLAVDMWVCVCKLVHGQHWWQLNSGVTWLLHRHKKMGGYRTDLDSRHTYPRPRPRPRLSSFKTKTKTLRFQDQDSEVQDQDRDQDL